MAAPSRRTRWSGGARTPPSWRCRPSPCPTRWVLRAQRAGGPCPCSARRQVPWSLPSPRTLQMFVYCWFATLVEELQFVIARMLGVFAVFHGVCVSVFVWLCVFYLCCQLRPSPRTAASVARDQPGAHPARDPRGQRWPRLPVAHHVHHPALWLCGVHYCSVRRRTRTGAQQDPADCQQRWHAGRAEHGYRRNRIPTERCEPC